MLYTRRFELAPMRADIYRELSLYLENTNIVGPLLSYIDDGETKHRKWITRHLCIPQGVKIWWGY